MKDIILTKNENKTKLTQSIREGKETIKITSGDVNITIKSVPKTNISKWR